MGQGDVSFGISLRRHRLAAGMTQEQLAEHSTVSVRAVRDLERGVTRHPRPETISLLAQALGLTDRETLALRASGQDMDNDVGSKPQQTVNWLSSVEPATPLFGRERDISALLTKLHKPGIRLVTLTGPGGIGKTRLSLAVARHIAPEFPDGVHFVSLGALFDPTLVSATIARSLVVKEPGNRPSTDRLIPYLRDKRTLILLDNCEHLLAACASVVTKLVSNCPGVKVVATSRAPLLLRPEHEYPVPPLAMPDQTSIGAAVGPPAGPAVELFLSRASAIDPTYQSDEAELVAVARICRRLEGVPLAIELAAARTRVMSATTLFDRLTSPLSILTDGYRDSPSRQQTLRKTIDWSYDLLSPPEQTLLARLAVFPGGATLEAIEAMQQALGDDPQQALIAVEGLVRASLVRRSDRSAATPRFVMLETIREYALERLKEHEGLDAAMRAQCLYYLAVSEQAMDTDADCEPFWIARLESERSNLHAALRWAEAKSDGLTYIRLVVSLAWFWLTTGSFSEGRHWLAKMLDATSEGSAELRARAYEYLGRLATHQSDFAAAEAAHYRALELFRRTDNQRAVAWVLQGLGYVFAAKGDRERSITHLNECIALSDNRDPSWGETRGLAQFLLGEVLLNGGDRTGAARARLLFDQALRTGQETRLRMVEGFALVGLSWMYFHDENLGRAMALGRRALRLASAARLRHLEVLAILSLGWFLLAKRDLESAVLYFHQALRRAVSQEQWMNVADGLGGTAAVAAKQGAHDHAGRLFAAATRLHDRVGSVMPPPGLAFVKERHAAMCRCDQGLWESGWSQGWDLSLDDAIAEALAIAG